MGTSEKAFAVVRSLSGRDRGRYYVIVGVHDESSVLLADGDRRKLGTPKRKNLKHLCVVKKGGGVRSFSGYKTSDLEIREVLKKYRIDPDQQTKE